MTPPNSGSDPNPHKRPPQHTVSWAERKKAVGYPAHFASWLEIFAELPAVIPPTSLFTTVNTRGGRLSGYVLGSLPTAGSWFTFPLEFLCNKSVPAEFFAAGICEGPQGNSEWLSLVIRNSSRALWVRAATGDAYGGNYFQEAAAILAEGLQRWHDGEEVVVAGIHAERLPTPLPKPLFADEINEDSDRFRPGR